MKNLGSKTLETNRLELRAQTMDEQEYLWRILMIPEVNRYYLTVPQFLREKLKDWNKQEEYYKADMEHASDPDIYRWSIFLKDTNECIGRISCHEANAEYREVDDPAIRGVGWYLDPKYQGQGYGKEAAKAMIKYMFEEVEIDSIITGAAIQNPASWKIMEGLGFKRTDKTHMVEYTYLDEPVEDYQYVLTKEMYLENKENIKTIK